MSLFNEFFDSLKMVNIPMVSDLIKLCLYPQTVNGWEIDGETVETVSDFIFLGSKITADGTETFLL